MSSLHKALLLLFIAYNIHLHDANTFQVPTRPPPYPFPPKVIRQLPSIDKLQKDGKEHDCYRTCDGTTRTCSYNFKVEWYQSMSKACYDCPFNASDCYRKDCVVADGLSRPITVVNRKLPGPSIEVCQYDIIKVRVRNELMASGTTIHWHGMYQRDQPYMDGTPYVTQCPITPGSTFEYEFTALQPGTYFWHSHIGLQRGDGVTGSLIIRPVKSNDPHRKLYDFDESEHKMLITDWTNQLAVQMFTSHYHSSGGIKPTSLLINGVGIFELRSGNRTAETSTERFDVTQGYRYRFRLINAEFLNCPVELSVDGHNITVIATDGSDLEPVTVTSLVSYSGERFDFIINADNEIYDYWIRIRGLLDCAAEPNPIRQFGVLHYEGAKNLAPAQNLVRNNILEINGVNQAEEQKVSLPISKLRSLKGRDDSLKPVPDYKFYVSYDLYAKNNSHFNKYPLYGYNQVLKSDLAVRTPQLNHISMKLPSSPLLYTKASEDHFCNQSSVSKSCEKEYCQCPHVLKVKLHSVVEIIIIDEGAPFDTNHPFHLHGYSFRVVGQRRLGTNTTVEKVKAFEKAGNMTRNLNNPPLKDTVTIPDGGYTIVRFKADNPGYWLLHCHIEFHAELGMALVFQVGEHEDMVAVPKNFPTCGNFENGGFETSGPAIVDDINDLYQHKNQSYDFRFEYNDRLNLIIIE